VHKLAPLVSKNIPIPIGPQTDAEQTWSEIILPLLNGINDNVIEIHHRGFTQILKNAIAYSGAGEVNVEVVYTAAKIRIAVRDRGVGVFEKMRSGMNLKDTRHAALELAKGKQAAQGTGLFFVSLLFDEFTMRSGDMVFSRLSQNDWLLAEHDDHEQGTLVAMAIHPRSPRTVEEVQQQASSIPANTVRVNVMVKRAAEGHEEGVHFEATRAGGKMQKITGETLESAEEAQTLLAPYGAFNEVFLDFAGIREIGQAFAEEIFRNFKSQHPQTKLSWGNAKPEVDEVIQGVAEAAA
jgi:hypothetical protein